jgi:two-component system, LuxR family, sensor kinase FixL
MSWVTIVFSMTASACLTMALIYAFIWWRQRDAWAYLLFALAALGAGAMAACDLAAMRSDSVLQFAAAIRWMQLSIWVSFLALGGFVWLYFRAGRLWLLGCVCALRTVCVIANFSTGQNLNFREISALHQVPFLGETVTVASGAGNPWMILGILSLLGLLLFVADASIAVWRRGERSQAVVVGGGILLFVLAGAAQGALAFWGIVPWPLTPSLLNLGILAAMGYELGGDAIRSTRLARDLRASAQQIALASEAANLGFWVREFRNNQVWASDQWRALFGFTKLEPLSHDKFLKLVHPDDREITQRALAIATQGEGPYRAEFRILRPDGATRWIDSKGRVDFDADAKPVRLMCVSTDITQIKQADLEAQQNRKEVAHLLRVASLGELSSALAHELNQPLAAILSNAQAAQLFLAKDNCDLQEIREILSDIVAADQRASEVIGRLRALLKKGEFQAQALSANDLILEVLKLMHRDLTARDLSVATQFSTELPMVRGDRVQLQQVLINLILNAGDAMSMQMAGPHVITVLTSACGEGQIRISVTDNGSGIEAGSEEKIFEPYHTTKAHGLGLGLSLSRSIILAHGGKLWAENQPLGGAIFHFTIPTWRGDSPS